MHRTKLLAALAVSSWLAACGGTSPEDARVTVSTQGVEPRIIGGSKSTSTQDSVVFLNMGSGYCTGTLIAPNLVLTARHCVQTMDESSACGTFLKDNVPSSMKVALGYGAMSGAAVAAGKKFFHETNTSGCSYDIALVQLDKDIPGAKISPVSFTPVKKGDTGLVAVGYGSVNDSNGDPAGRLQRGGISVQAAASSSYSYTTKAGKKIAVDVSAGEFATGESTCFGDSGGPLFDTAGNVIGVTSRGIDQFCIDRPSIWSDTVSHMKLITEAAVSAGHPLDTSSTGGGGMDADAGSDDTDMGSSGSGSSGSGSSASSGQGSGSNNNNNNTQATPASGSPSGEPTVSGQSSSTGGCNHGGVGTSGTDDLALVLGVLFGVVLLRAHGKRSNSEDAI
jgi:V8-like Glu-specific endopeptidase